MIFNTLSICLGFLFIIGFLLWFIIDNKDSWKIKGFSIIVSVAFILVIWHELPSYLGWASPEIPPSEFKMLWGEVQEPLAGDVGFIKIWLKPYGTNILEKNPLRVFSYKNQRFESRVYLFPYSTNLQQKVEGAKEMIKQNKTVLSGRKQTSTEGNSKIDKEGKGDNFSISDDIMFYELPPSKRVVKD